MPKNDAASFSGTLYIATYPNKYSVVVPPEAPFYRIGLVLTKKDGSPMIEGRDYYLGYYFQEQSEAERDAIYGGIMLLNETEVNYTLLSTGRENRVPVSEIGKFLVRDDIKDPRNVDWSALMKYAPVISPIDPPKDLPEAILRDEIVKALEDVRLAIHKHATDLDAIFDEVRQQIKDTGTRLFTEEYYQHDLVKNAHTPTAEDLRALSVTGRAVDCAKAYGRTLAQISEIMATAGVNARRLGRILGFDGGDLYGRVAVTSGNVLEFKSSDGKQFIRLDGAKYTIGTTDVPLDIVADVDNNDPGLAVELGCGLNTLWVHSGTDVKAPVFNGEYLITPDMVELYLSSVQIRPANAYFESTDRVKIYGNGKIGMPVRIEISIPTATNTIPGAFAVTNIATYPGQGIAISQAAVTTIKDLLDNYVSDTFTINGKSFVQSGGKQQLTLTTADIGLDRVNNTAPLIKPITNAITAALSQKALKEHTHNFNDLTGVPVATDVVSGLTYLHDGLGTATDRAVTSKQGFLLQNKIDEISSVSDSLMPGWVGEGASFTNGTILPPEFKGDSEAFARNNGARGAALFVQDSKLYLLSNYHSGTPDTRGIYYVYAPLDAAGNIGTPVKTTIRYRPIGMDKHPGVELIEVLCSGQEGLIARGNDNLYYLVAFNGTIDQRKQQNVCQLNIPPYVESAAPGIDFVINPEIDTLASDDDFFYIIRTDISADSKVPISKFRVGGYKVAKADMVTPELDAVALKLTFANVSGNCADLVKPGPFADAIGAGDMLAYYTPEGKAKWSSWVELARGTTRNIVSSRTGTKIRVSVNCATAAWSPTEGRSFGWWTYSYDIDQATGAVSVMNANVFPIKIDAAGLFYATGTPIGRGPKWAGTSTFTQVTERFHSEGKVYSYLNDTRSTADIGLAVQTLPADMSFDAFLAAQTDGVATIPQATVPMVMDSPYIASMTAPLFIPGKNELWVNHLMTNYCVAATYDTSGSYGVPGWSGFGPDNARRVVAWEDYSTLAQIPMIVTPEAIGGVLDGAFFQGPRSAAYKVPYGTSIPESGRLTLSDAEWTKLRELIVSTAPSGEAGSFAKERITEAVAAGTGNYAFGLWVVGTTMPSGPFCLVTVMTRNVNGALQNANLYAFQVYPTIANNIISFTQSRSKLLNARLDRHGDVDSVSTGTWDAARNIRPGQAYLITRDGVNYRFVISNAALLQTRNGPKNYTIGINMTRDASEYRGGIVMVLDERYDINPVYETYVREFSAITRLDNAIDPIYLSGHTLSDALITGTTERQINVIVAGVKTASNWILRATESMTAQFIDKKYVIPPTDIDLRTLGAPYKNQKFHVHVLIENGVAGYMLSLFPQPNSDVILHVGTVTTDSNRITAIDIDNTVYLGTIQELIEHESFEDAHRWDVDGAYTRSPFSLIRAGDVNEPGSEGYVNAGRMESLATTQGAVAGVRVRRAVIGSQFVKYGADDWSVKHMIVGGTRPPAAVDGWANSNGLLFVTSPWRAVMYDATDAYRMARFRVITPGVAGTQVPLKFEVVVGHKGTMRVIVVGPSGVIEDSGIRNVEVNALQTFTWPTVPAAAKVWITVIVGTSDATLGEFPTGLVAFKVTSDTTVVYRSNDQVYVGIPADCPEPASNAVSNAVCLVFDKVASDKYVPVISVNSPDGQPNVVYEYNAQTKEFSVYVPIVYGYNMQKIEITEVEVALIPLIP